MKSKLNTNITIQKPAHAFSLKPTAVHGFTLIEVLIAMFLLVTAIFAIISTTDLLIKENAFDRMATTATTLAKDKMEFLKNQSYDNYTGLSGGKDYATSDSTVQSTSTNAFFTRTWTIDPPTNVITPPPTPPPPMTTITTTVSWSWMGDKNVTLITIVGQ